MDQYKSWRSFSLDTYQYILFLIHSLPISYFHWSCFERRRRKNCVIFGIVFIGQNSDSVHHHFVGILDMRSIRHQKFGNGGWDGPCCDGMLWFLSIYFSHDGSIDNDVKRDMELIPYGLFGYITTMMG